MVLARQEVGAINQHADPIAPKIGGAIKAVTGGRNSTHLLLKYCIVIKQHSFWWFHCNAKELPHHGSHCFYIQKKKKEFTRSNLAIHPPPKQTTPAAQC
jgi:hypothetical protein